MFGNRQSAHPPLRQKRQRNSQIDYQLLEQRNLLAAGLVNRLISIDSTGTEGANDYALFSSISNDGRYVTFMSGATNLVPGETIHNSDVFIRDRDLGTTVKVEYDRDFSSGKPSISGDGRFIVFGGGISGDTSDPDDLYLYDMNSGTYEEIARAYDGGDPNGSVNDPSISNDGRYVVFSSTADNLVPNDDNDQEDIFVYHRVTGITTRENTHADGTQSNHRSGQPDISADGRFVVYHSLANTLVDIPVTQNAYEVFLKDRDTGTTSLVSVNRFGVESNSSGRSPSISDDGRYVAFYSRASDLIENDTNGSKDIFVRDLFLGVTSRVSEGFNGGQTNGPSEYPAISGDGLFVAFESSSTNLIENDNNGKEDIFLTSLESGNTIRISENTDGTGGDGESRRIAMGPTGDFVSYSTQSTNLSDIDNSSHFDLYFAVANNEPVISLASDDSDSEARLANGGNISIAGTLSVEDLDFEDVVSGTIESVDVVGNDNGIDNSTLLNMLALDSNVLIDSTSTTGTMNWSFDSGDETFGFLSFGERLELTYTVKAIDPFNASDTHQIKITIIGYYDQERLIDLVSYKVNGDWSDSDSWRPSTSHDGRFTSFSSAEKNLTQDPRSNNYSEIFVNDRESGETIRVSSNWEGGAASRASVGSKISSDGRYVLFSSSANDLLNDETSATLRQQIYMRDLSDGSLVLISENSSGEFANGSSGNADFSEDGRYVAFVSSASDLVANDTNGDQDIFVRDLDTGITTRVNTGANGEQADGDSYLGNISGDGQFVSFSSNETFGLGGTADKRDVYVKNITTGPISRVSNDFDTGSEGNESSVAGRLSYDGRFVAFSSAATNLVPDDTNQVEDVFLTDLQLGTTIRVSTDFQGNAGNQGSAFSDISGDGRYVAFVSSADNLTPDDTNGLLDVFVFDTEAGLSRRIGATFESVNQYRSTLSASFSGDGRSLVFMNEGGLLEDDNNGVKDVFTTAIGDFSEIHGRAVIYHNSGLGAVGSVATDKSLLMPGQTATFENYSSYINGINGFVIDLVSTGSAGIDANDFEFHFGNSNDIASWPLIHPTVNVAVEAGGGPQGADRITLTFEDGEITNGWLRTTILANNVTGLAENDVFYFGNAIGETGNDPDNAIVNLQDLALARENQTGFGVADITNRYDIDRDSRVNLVDVALIRENQSGFAPLKLITIPGAGSGRNASVKGKGSPQFSGGGLPGLGFQARSFDSADSPLISLDLNSRDRKDGFSQSGKFKDGPEQFKNMSHLSSRMNNLKLEGAREMTINSPTDWDAVFESDEFIQSSEQVEQAGIEFVGQLLK